MESGLLGSFKSPHSGCTSYLNPVTAHIEAAKTHEEDVIANITFVTSLIGPAKIYIEVAKVHIEEDSAAQITPVHHAEKLRQPT